MTRRGRPRPRKPAPDQPARAESPAESMMEFYLRTRAPVDTSIDLDVERSCTSKQQYASEAQARAIATMQGMSGSLFTYHCRYCEFWHLTRRPNSGGPPEITDE